MLGGGPPLTVQVGGPLPLRGAVQVAEELRADGHEVRVTVRPGEATMYLVRHGSFATSEEAEVRARELVRLGLAGQVVRAR
ncbi:MAG: hypothetical protein A3F92_08885 [Candidatus Rokubacteria bacterium RIFCSPLOWO2_12_FULL_71_22]|nr:MAG: hypothetical protein A3F92_08885 [Candidatus Rokubacteria bacterium RIFCSPLOWO2_12_FULL_71_22]